MRLGDRVSNFYVVGHQEHRQFQIKLIAGHGYLLESYLAYHLNKIDVIKDLYRQYLALLRTL